MAYLLEFESCVNSRYSKTLLSIVQQVRQFESCVNSRYSKTNKIC